MQSKNVVLVGNGPSMLHSGLGKTIDSFNTVIRFNRFTNAGYAADTGTKTDIWFGYMEPHAQLKTFGKVIFHWVGTVKIQKKFDKIKEACAQHGIPFERLSENIVQKAYAALGQEYNKVPKPRCGFTGIVYALEHFDKVYITGFDCNTTQEYYHKKHGIMGNTKRKHDIQKEKDVITKWLKMGRVLSLSAMQPVY